MKALLMPDDPVPELAARRVVFIMASLSTYFLNLLINNGVFVFIVILCLFGSIVPLVNAKANQEMGWFVRAYSAFYSFMVTSVVVGGLFYGLGWNQYVVMPVAAILAAIMGEILHLLFQQVSGTPDLFSLLRLVLRIIKLIGRIASAAYRAANLDTPDEDKDKKENGDTPA